MKHLFKNIWYQIHAYFTSGVSIEIDLSGEVSQWLLEESTRTNKCINQIVHERLIDYMRKMKEAEAGVVESPKIEDPQFADKLHDKIKESSRKLF